jgi:hypothetical protein
MESEIAKNPRIIIDNSVLVGVTAGTGSDMLMFKDEDGYWCLDYMVAYLDYLDHQTGSDRSEAGCAVRRTWVLGTRGKALGLAAVLENGGNTKGAKYWRWFAARFEKSMRAVNPYLFSESGAPILFPE